MYNGLPRSKFLALSMEFTLNTLITEGHLQPTLIKILKSESTSQLQPFVESYGSTQSPGITTHHFDYKEFTTICHDYASDYFLIYAFIHNKSSLKN